MPLSDSEMIFRNGPEYEARLRKPFTPPTVTFKEIHDAVPKHLLRRRPLTSTLYILRDLSISLLLYKFASLIPGTEFGGYVSVGWKRSLLKSGMWGAYWWLQGLMNAGIFCLGHDAGHGTLYDNVVLNNIIGFILHSYLFVPYFAWRATHHTHHKATSSIERDENYVPYPRSTFPGLPDQKTATAADYSEVFEETPLYTLLHMLVMQGFGWWIYLTRNAMGSAAYPKGTNHFSPSSPLFKPSQRKYIILSNLGLCITATVLGFLGRDFFLWCYFIPYVLANHWIVMFTYLHHSDPTIPHYRKKEWTFLRGAAATVDRPLLGWIGRFFFHNISHDHVAHHFFIGAPFYNGPEITKAIKSVLKEDYNYDSTPAFYALYRSFTQCLFIEDEGDIVFYKNKHGVAARRVQEFKVGEGLDKKLLDPGVEGELVESAKRQAM